MLVFGHVSFSSPVVRLNSSLSQKQKTRLPVHLWRRVRKSLGWSPFLGFQLPRARESASTRAAATSAAAAAGLANPLAAVRHTGKAYTGFPPMAMGGLGCNGA